MAFSFTGQGGTPDDFGEFRNPSKNQADIPFITKSGGVSAFGGVNDNQFTRDLANIKIEPVTTYNPNTGGDPNSEPNTIGRRLMNPLGYFASYTYNISLYMLSADAYAAFLATGRTSIEAFDTLVSGRSVSGAGGGTFLIAQSGGIGPNQNRGPGMELDYYIDNLSIMQLNPGSGTGTPTAQYDVTFNIVEPYGFSFLTEITRAANTLQQYDQSLSPIFTGTTATGLGGAQGSVQLNGLRMQYVIGIRFYGYDIAGNPIQSREGIMGGVEASGSSLNAGVFERFFDITLHSVKFKLGKTTTYECKAVITPQQAFGLKYGHIPPQVTVEGATILECLMGNKGLITALNQQQQQLYDEGKIEQTVNYAVQFKPEAKSIEDAPMWYDGNNSEQRYNGSTSGAKTSDQSNPFTEFRAFPDNSTKTITFSPDTPIVNAIENIVKESSFMTVSLLRIEDNYDAKNKNPDIIIDNTQPIYWFSITPEISNPRWDSKLNSWAYDILYMIEKFEIPFLYTTNVVPDLDFYGIQKSYRYYFTGQNSEVLDYQQDINLAYQINLAGLSAGSISPDVQLSNRPSGQSTQTAENLALTSQNAVLTQIYDPNSFAKAKITILGDPDYLAPPSTSVNSLYQRFYGGDGFTIKPTGGKNFIEIVFFEGKDYSTQTGIFDINRAIGMTYQQDPSISPGVVYEVSKVTSKFSQGKFTQDLELIVKDVAAVAAALRTRTENQTASVGTTVDGTGLRPDQAVGTTNPSPTREGAGLINPYGLGPTNKSSTDDNNPVNNPRYGPTRYDYGPGSMDPTGGFNNSDPFANPLSKLGWRGDPPFGP